MNIKASLYEAPCAEVLETISAEVLCASQKGNTDDFEIEDFEF